MPEEQVLPRLLPETELSPEPPPTSRESQDKDGYLHLDRKAAVRQSQRNERWLDVLANGKVLLARVLIALAVSLVVFAVPIMGIYYLAPESWSWLSAAQVNRIETAATSGSLSFVIARIIRHL